MTFYSLASFITAASPNCHIAGRDFQKVAASAHATMMHKELKKVITAFDEVF